MAVTYKRLGAIVSGGVIATPDLLYTASSSTGTSTVISTISICNSSASAVTYRLCVSTLLTFEAKGYIAYGCTVPANDSIFLTIGATLDPTNKYILCSGSSNALSFNIFGAEYY